MSNVPPVDQQHLIRVENRGRRVFLKGLAAALGACTLWHVSGSMRQLERLSGGTALAASGYLQPRYLPPGYKLLAEWTDVADPSGRGHTEYVAWFVNPAETWSLEHPIIIHQTPAPRPSWLSGIQAVPGEPLTLAFANGHSVPATYTAGWWVRPTKGSRPAPQVWDATDMHALTFVRNNMTIAVRGSRMADIQQDELLRVAASLR